MERKLKAYTPTMDEEPKPFTSISDKELDSLPPITINDLTGLGSFYRYSNIDMRLTKLPDGRVIGAVKGTVEAYRLMALYQTDVQVSLHKFLAAQREVRNEMLTLRNGVKRKF